MTTRRNTRCPACMFDTATHFCASNRPGYAWYHCVRIRAVKSKKGGYIPGCDGYFEGPAPKPLRTRNIPDYPVELEEAA